MDSTTVPSRTTENGVQAPSNAGYGLLATQVEKSLAMEAELVYAQLSTCVAVQPTGTSRSRNADGETSL